MALCENEKKTVEIAQVATTLFQQFFEKEKKGGEQNWGKKKVKKDLLWLFFDGCFHSDGFLIVT